MLHGRATESGRLDSLFADAAAGRGGALVVRGEPGVGKTALIAEAVARADATVLSAQGVESESPLPFAALHRLLRPVLGHLDRVPDVQSKALLVALGEREGDSADRFMVFVATLSLLVEAAGAGETSSTVVVVDDAHWLDAVSAEALLFVARRIQSDGIAIVFGAREGDVRRFDAPGLDELILGGLDAQAAGDLLAERAGAELGDGVRDALLAHTEGNPLALVELPSVLSPDQLTGASGLPPLLPVTAGVERAFLDRCLRLSAPARDLVLVAASDDSGRVAIIQGAAGAMGIGDQALDEAERSGLIKVSGTEVTFRHPLVRSAVYAAATARERQAVHRALASAMEAAGEDDRRAWHLALGTQGLAEPVAAELDAVGVRSERRGGHESASAAWERAAALSPSAEDQARRLHQAARSSWVAGQPARARTLADEAGRRTADPLLKADVDMLRARIEWNVGSAAAGHRLIMTAAREVAPFDGARALEMSMLGTALATFGGESAAAGVTTTDFLPGVPDDAPPRMRCMAALLTGQQHVLGNRLGVAARALREAFELVELVGEDENLLANTALAAFHVGDWRTTVRDFSRVLEGARERGDVSRMVFALSRLPMADIPAGRWDEAGACTDEALTLAQATGQPALTGLPLAWAALLSALRGTSGGDDAHDGVAALVARQALGIGVVAVLDIAAWAKGITAMTGNDVPAAFHHLSQLELPAMQRAAGLDRLEAAARANRSDVVVGWADELEAFARDTGATWAAAAAAHGRALVDEGPDAGARFERALDLHATDRRPFAEARTQLAYGELLRRSGRRVDARSLLRSSIETFDELGAAPWGDRARRELRASGETARKRDQSTVLDLTPQEHQVVRLVREGLSNRDVAGRLFVSPRTVEYHLSHAYQKLGVRSRGELISLTLS